MELTLEKKAANFNWMDLYFKSPDYLFDFSTSKLNLETFRGTITKLKELKEQNIIDDKQFKDILILLASNYIENEVELRVTNKVNQKIYTLFEKA